MTFPPFSFLWLLFFSNADIFYICQNSSFALIKLTRSRQVYECFTKDHGCSVKWVDLLSCEIKPYPSHELSIVVILQCHSQWLKSLPGPFVVDYFLLLCWRHYNTCGESFMVTKAEAVTIQWGRWLTEQHCPNPGRSRWATSHRTQLHRTTQRAKVNGGKVPKLLPGEKSALPRYPQDSLLFGIPQRIYIEFAAIQFVSEI